MRVLLGLLLVGIAECSGGSSPPGGSAVPTPEGSQATVDKATAETAAEQNVAAKKSVDGRETLKPAILFVSRRLPMYEGGSFIRMNMARLDRLGYRIAYCSYPDLYAKEPGYPLKFDVVILLDLPSLDLQTDALKPKAATLVTNLRKLLHTGGGLMVFNASQRSNMKVVETLLGGYGAHPLTGCLLG